MENRTKILIASFLTLVAAGVGFVTRGAVAPAWATMGIGPTEFGQIMGFGFLGFGVVILAGGVFVELAGYKKTLLIAVILHFISALMLLAAPSYYESCLEADPATATDKVVALLTYSVLIFSVCNGLYEGVINPLIGQLYPENQTHYLNILHAGWPGGMVLGGLIAACFQGQDAWLGEIPWHYALSSYSLVLILITLMVIKQPFPETVAGGGKVPFGVLFSCFLSIPFLVLIILHGLIGYMELGVDSWQTRLMENLVDNSVVVLMYTSVLMFILRFCAGPIVHKLNPIGLLLLSSVIAVAGLYWLSIPTDQVFLLFAAATLYSLGKAFLWPTMLAVAGERYPQSGAVAMGALGAAGMITVGAIGTTMIGAQQSNEMATYLKSNSSETYTRYEDGSGSFLGYEFLKLDPAKEQAAREEDLEKALVDIPAEKQKDIEDNFTADSIALIDAFSHGGRQALRKTAIIPMLMAIGFLALFLYYKSQGGYKVITLDEGSDESDNYPSEDSGSEEPAAEEADADEGGDTAEAAGEE